MGISGARSKLKKGGSRPQGWYKLTNGRWEERTSQNTGDEFITFCWDGESADSEDTTEVLLFLGKSAKIGDYVRIEDGALVNADEDEEYGIPENSGVGRFFASLSEHGISDSKMDKIGDKPGILNGTIVRIIQEPVLDADGEPKKNDAGYAITNTVVDKIGTEKDMKGASGKSSKPGKAASSKAASSKTAAKSGSRRKPADDEDEEEEEDEDQADEDDEDENDEEESDSEDTDDEEDEDEEEEEPAPKRKPGRSRKNK